MINEVPRKSVNLVVNGGLMRGMRAEHRMVTANAQFLGEVLTASVYRLWSIADAFPGMIRIPASGAAISAEIYRLPYEGFIDILNMEPDGLCVGRVLLSDGSTSLGVLAEPRLVEGHTDITSYGGWRRYVEARSIPQIPKK